jgi:hypothetical protein
VGSYRHARELSIGRRGRAGLLRGRRAGLDRLPAAGGSFALEASAVADPHTTVKADVERLLTSPLLSPKVSVSGHVYDIATGRVTTTVDARYP